MKTELIILLSMILIQSCSHINESDLKGPEFKVDNPSFNYSFIKGDSLDSLSIEFDLIYHSEKSGNQVTSYFYRFIDIKTKRGSSIGWRLLYDDRNIIEKAESRFNKDTFRDTLSFRNISSIPDPNNFNYEFVFEINGFLCDSFIWKSLDTLGLKKFNYTFRDTFKL